jgi:hypothetical protein
MAEDSKIVAHGGLEKETKNAVRFQTEWGVVYIPKSQLEKIGSPDRIKITVESENG